MPLKKNVTDRVVRELYNVMAAEHFARLSGVLVRLLNEWRRAGAPGERASAEGLEERIRSLEQKAERLQIKLEALEQILARRAPVARRKTPEPADAGDLP